MPVDKTFEIADTAETPERGILVGIKRPDISYNLEATLSELERLAHTAGVQVVDTTYQRLDKPNPATFIGSGKAKEIAKLCDELNADVVIFDDELTPSQQSNLERIFDKDIKVIDRTALILDIFALHAKTREGRLQVRLAQNQYLYPRLRGMWAHLAAGRMGGGVGSRFGEGESQLEVDRRLIRKRITSIKRELEHLSCVRDIQRERRYGGVVYKVAIAGYTNAGKSTLLNRLCESNVLSDDLLFATLDSTTRMRRLPNGREATFTDTVGFIQKLPTTLIEAFKSTLSEITGADLIIHVVDASSEEALNQIDVVNEIMQQIGAQHIPRILAFNKIDALDAESQAALSNRFADSCAISAKTGLGIDQLLIRIERAAESTDELMNLKVPFDRGDLISLAHTKCSIISETFTEDGIDLCVHVPKKLIGKYKSYLVN